MSDLSETALTAEFVARAVAPFGLNLVGVATAAAHDAAVEPARRLAHRLPGVRSVVVIGNGGGAFWESYRRACRARPALAARAEPLDDYTRDVVEGACAAVVAAAGGRILYPFGFYDDAPSFTRLAILAGLGRPSRLGVLVHPEFGPWMALRAAIAVPTELHAPRPADGFDPCPTCPAPCATACPAAAVSPAGWDVARCAATRAAAADPCAPACHARVACVLAEQHRYPADALAHHQGRARAPLLRVLSGS